MAFNTVCDTTELIANVDSSTNSVCATIDLITTVNKFGEQATTKEWKAKTANVLCAIIELLKIISTFIKSSFICFENYKIGILDILNNKANW